MRTIVLKIALTNLLLTLIISGHTKPNGNWAKIDTKSGINLYERWVEINNSFLVKERKGEMVINSSMNIVISTLSDPSKTGLWMENVSDSYLIDRISHNEWLTYTCFSLPWPFQNRDMVSVSRLTYSTPTSFMMKIESKDDARLVKGNTVRLNNYSACWQVEDMGNGKIYVSFSAIISNPPEYPRFITDTIIRNTFLSNLLKLKIIVSV
jgi:hypothetical protein